MGRVAIVTLIWWKSLGSYAKDHCDQDEPDLTIPVSTKMSEIYHEERHTELGYTSTFSRLLGESDGVWELKGEAGTTTHPLPLLVAFYLRRTLTVACTRHPMDAVHDSRC